MYRKARGMISVLKKVVYLLQFKIIKKKQNKNTHTHTHNQTVKLYSFLLLEKERKKNHQNAKPNQTKFQDSWLEKTDENGYLVKQ